MKMTNEAKFYTMDHSEINGRGIWRYMISCPIGDLFIVEYEQRDLSLLRFFCDTLDESNKKYQKILLKMVKGIL